jgi:hypothetical protein
MALLNRTVGKPISVRLPPTFDGFEVVGGTWKPKDQTQNTQHKNAKQEVFNVGFYAPGTVVDCDLNQYVTDPPTPDLVPSQVIDEVATPDNPVPGQWLVMKADPDDFGTQGISFHCTLMKSDSLDLTQTTPA